MEEYHSRHSNYRLAGIDAVVNYSTYRNAGKRLLNSGKSVHEQDIGSRSAASDKRKTGKPSAGSLKRAVPDIVGDRIFALGIGSKDVFQHEELSALLENAVEEPLQDVVGIEIAVAEAGTYRSADDENGYTDRKGDRSRKEACAGLFVPYYQKSDRTEQSHESGKKAADIEHRSLLLQNDVIESAADSLHKFRRRKAYLSTDTTAADVEELKALGSIVDNGHELLFHTDRSAASADIAGDLGDILYMEELNGLLADAFSSFFEVELKSYRQEEAVVFARLAMRNEGI